MVDGRAPVPLRFAVLGPVRVWRGDDELHVGPPQQRAMLAQLLASAGQPVSLTELIDFLWPGDPPSFAANVVHRYVGGLRRQLEPGLPSRKTGHWLVRDGGGYRLKVDAETLDLLQFRTLADDARRAAAGGRSEDAVSLFVQALNLWRGPCAAGIEPASQAHPLFTAIGQERAALVQEAADSALHAGHPRAGLSMLREAAAQDHLAEPLQARLILLLAAAGHQAEALKVYQTVCRQLADELGIDPGNELRDAHERVLHQHLPRVAAGQPATPSKPGSTVSPAQLPADLPTFTGRRDELALLHALVEPAARPPSTVLIVAIDGMAGIGKPNPEIWRNFSVTL